MKLAAMAGLILALLPTLNISLGSHCFFDLITLTKSLFFADFRSRTQIHRKTGVMFKVKMKIPRSPKIFQRISSLSVDIVYTFTREKGAKFKLRRKKDKTQRYRGHLAKGMTLVQKPKVPWVKYLPFQKWSHLK